MAEIWGAIVGVSSWIIGPVIPLILGGDSIICRRAFEKGVTIGVFLFFKNFLATVVLGSAAVISRTDRTPLGCAGVFRVLHLAILDVVSQLCSFTGLRYTSASFSSSLAACEPAFIFLAACFFGMEYVQWTARSFQAKVLGMTLMVGGGCIVGFYQGPTISIMQSPASSRIGVDAQELREDWFRGPLLILVALAALVWYNLQIKNVAAQYGSAIWLGFYITAADTLMTLAAALGLEARSPFAWKIIADIRLVSYVYSGVVVSGLALFLQITLTRMRDPVFAAAFSPVSLVFVMMMSLVALRDVIHLGSILGAISIIVGLFMLLWGKMHDPTPPVLPIIQESASLPAPHSSPASAEARIVGETDELSILERGEQERRQHPEACQSQERPETQQAELEVELPERSREAEVREQLGLEPAESRQERSETQSERLREAALREIEMHAPEQPAVDTSTQERLEVEESEQPRLPALEQPEADGSSETQLVRPREAELREREQPVVDTSTQERIEVEESEQPGLPALEQLEADESSETQLERPREAELREPEQPVIDTSTQERIDVEESEQPGLPALEQLEADESSETQLERLREAEQPAIDSSTQEKIDVEESEQPGLPALEQLEADVSSETQLERPREAELREPEQPAVDTSTQDRMEVEESEQPEADESSETQLEQLREPELPAHDSTQDRLEVEQLGPRDPGI